MRGRLPHVPAVRGQCGLEITVEDGARRRRSAATPTTSSATASSAPRARRCKALHEDPDRLRTPLRPRARRRASRRRRGTRPSREIDRRLPADRRPSTAATRSPPTSATRPRTTSARCSTAASLLKALGRATLFSASTVDQYPKQLASALMFGSGATVAVPDVDRTDHLLILGANPLASNGSLLTAPDMRGRLRAIRARGGKVVVVDPRRTRTAARGRRAPLHPPGDRRAAALRARARAVRRGPRRAARAGRPRRGPRRGPRAGRPASRPRTSRARAASPRRDIRRMARELAAAPRAAVYGRIGTTTQRFGTTASWLVDVLNVAHRQPRPARRRDVPAAADGVVEHGRRARARARRGASGAGAAACAGCGEVFGELPVACLAEEIETPGDGQVRALLTVRRQPGGEHAELRAPGARRSSASSSWSASTSTSTRPRATPTSSSPAPRRCSARTTTSR